MNAADPTFVSLADLLRTAAPRPPDAIRAAPAAELSDAPTIDAASAGVEVPAALACVSGDPESPARVAMSLFAGAEAPEDTRAAIRDARLFRAALADAFDRLGSRLVRSLADSVLARELHLAPAEVANIAQRLIAESLSEEPVRLRVAAVDAGFTCALPVTIDPALEPGDAVLDCRSGSIDARLRVRLAVVLAELTA